jgi:hypothetical protein
MRQSCLRGDVGEGAVAVVVKQVTGRFAGARAGIERVGVHQEDVEPAVVVVIEEGRAAAHLLEQELLVFGAAGDVFRVEKTRGGGDVGEDDRRFLSSERERTGHQRGARAGCGDAQEVPARRVARACVRLASTHEAR